METKKITIDISTLPCGDIMMSFKDEKWGPVVVAKTREDAEAEFIEALKICLITKSLMSVESKNYPTGFADNIKSKTNPQIVGQELILN